MTPPRHLPSSEFRNRIRRLLARQRTLRLDVILLVTPVNRYYFTGLDASNGVLLTEPGQTPSFHTDSRYLTMARRLAPWLPCRALWRPADEPAVLAGMGAGWRRIGFEGRMDAARFLRLRAALPDAEWVDVTAETDRLRAVKSPAEQARLRAAVEANDRLFAELLRGIRPGMSEWTIRTLARREADRMGQGEAFDTIVCAGRNAAEPHHNPNDTLLRRSQPLLIDLGLKLDHYCSDMTRCTVFGTPSRLFRELHGIVLKANRRAVRAIRPGRLCRDIDALARDTIARAGYGAFFGHGLGHGLGLEVHETPSLSPACATVLEPGMVVTVEPGIYLPGRLGVRIEDVVLVTDSGCEVLTRTPHQIGWS